MFIGLDHFESYKQLLRACNTFKHPLHFYELFVIAAAIGFLSFYSPGIPSGSLLIMAPVYVSLGLPVAGIGLLIAIDLFVDMFLTVANVTGNVTAATLLSRNER